MIVEEETYECNAAGCEQKAAYAWKAGIRNGAQRYLRYCEKCRRISSLRKTAYKAGKEQPSWVWCRDNWPSDMGCNTCGKTMSYKAPQEDMITLQHWNNGSMSFICYSCNCSHGGSALGDDFFDIPKGYKLCAAHDDGQGKILSIVSFSNKSSKKDGKNPTCKECVAEYDRMRYIRDGSRKVGKSEPL